VLPGFVLMALTSIRLDRLLEMQVFICEVVGKFSLTLPEDHSVCPRFASSLMPTMPDGTKGAPLCIKRIV
jgi:hypothetical protein